MNPSLFLLSEHLKALINNFVDILYETYIFFIISLLELIVLSVD